MDLIFTDGDPIDPTWEQEILRASEPRNSPGDRGALHHPEKVDYRVFRLAAFGAATTIALVAFAGSATAVERLRLSHYDIESFGEMAGSVEAVLGDEDLLGSDDEIEASWESGLAYLRDLGVDVESMEGDIVSNVGRWGGGRGDLGIPDHIEDDES